LVVEEGLAPAGDDDAFEKPGGSEGVVADEGLGDGAVVGVEEEDAAVGFCAVVVELGSGREKKGGTVTIEIALVGGLVGFADVGMSGLVTGDDGEGHLSIQF